MPSHLVRRILWGLTWRWLIVLASLNLQVPPIVVPAIVVLLAAGLVVSLWRRHDLLGSAWRLLLAVAVVNLGFWLGSPILVPAITLAICLTIGDLWWSIAGFVLDPANRDEMVEPTPAAAFQERVVSLPPSPPLPPPPPPSPVMLAEPRRRRASRGRTSGGFRLLLVACVMAAIALVTAPVIASTASGRFSAAFASIGQRVQQLTAAAPAPATSAAPASAPTPAPTPTATAVAIPAPTPTDPGTALAPLAPNGLCVSLPDGRYELQLPNGQTIVVKTRHRAGCPDLGTILKALQNAGGGSD